MHLRSNLDRTYARARGWTESAAARIGNSTRQYWLEFRSAAQARAVHCGVKRVERRDIAAKLLIAGGILLLAYVGLQYYTMFSRQRQLESQFHEQQRHPSRTTDAPGANGTIDPIEQGLTRLSIPKINLDAIVVEGTNARDLLLGPGHIEDTAEPGARGNAGISGHRDTFFRHIYELEKGDIIDVQRGGKTYQYEVTEKKVVDPSDISVLRQTPDARLTLVTCYPTHYIGPAPERLVVSSKLASGNASNEQAAPSSSVKRTAATSSQ